MQHPVDRQRRAALAAGAALALLALAVTLATPSLDLPVGTATATGPSMGDEGMQVVGYADAPLATVEVGDAVVYRHDGRLVHHRVVGETARGYVTKGDAVPTTDQALGAPPVTDAALVGVVVVRLPLGTVARAAALLAACWAALCWRLLARRGPEHA